MPATHSTVLARLAQTDERVQDYEFDADNDMGVHWLYLNDGWIDSESGCHAIHETTVADTLRVLKCSVVECFDDCCSRTASVK